MNPVEVNEPSSSFMDRVTEDYISLRHLTRSINEFLSPLLLACFAIHLIFLSMHVRDLYNNVYNLLVGLIIAWLLGKNLFNLFTSWHLFQTNRWFLGSGYKTSSLLVTCYVWTSCLQYSGRMFLVVYYAAELHSQNSELLLILQDKFKMQVSKYDINYKGS